MMMVEITRPLIHMHTRYIALAHPKYVTLACLYAVIPVVFKLEEALCCDLTVTTCLMFTIIISVDTQTVTQIG
jgi:hypothetical protein